MLAILERPLTGEELAIEAHAANGRCQRVLAACDVLALELEREGKVDIATRLRKRVQIALRGRS